MMDYTGNMFNKFKILPKWVIHYLQDSEIHEKGYTFVKGIINPSGILSKLVTLAKRSRTNSMNQQCRNAQRKIENKR